MNIWKEIIKPIVVLTAICLVCSALLAVTNMVTLPIIEVNAEKAANTARLELLPSADGFKAVNIKAKGITGIYEATNGEGYVISAETTGYGGNVPVMVAFDKDGKIAAVNFLENSETPGLGQKIRQPKFAKAFKGLGEKELKLADIDAISGATVSSGAAVAAVNKAVSCYKENFGVPEVVLTDDEIRAILIPSATTITKGTAPAGAKKLYEGDDGSKIIYAEVGEGFYKKPFVIAVGFDPAGTISGVWIDASQETEGVGTQVGGLEWGAQFIGKTTASQFDAIGGATVTSTAAAAAIDQVIAMY